MTPDQRAKFERWAPTAGFSLAKAGDDYNAQGTDDAYAAWQAAIDANGVAELVADNARLRTDWTNAMFEAVELGTLLKEAHRSVCSLECPSQWKTSEGQKHSPLCQRITAALAKHEGREG